MEIGCAAEREQIADLGGVNCSRLVADCEPALRAAVNASN